MNSSESLQNVKHLAERVQVTRARTREATTLFDAAAKEQQDASKEQKQAEDAFWDEVTSHQDSTLENWIGRLLEVIR